MASILTNSKVLDRCVVCGVTGPFKEARILWSDLIAEWQLSPQEVDYIDQQQGTHCTQCGARLRSMVLARAILDQFAEARTTFAEWTSTRAAGAQAVLEISTAEGLTEHLQKMPHYTGTAYPGVDMNELPFQSNSFDLVVHSDTLEHVRTPIHALSECRRVLKRHGVLCYTVPTVVGRLSRTRAGMPRSYHGPEGSGDDYLVYTEFGADMWTYPLKAGFTNVQITTIEYPAAIAITCIKD